VAGVFKQNTRVKSIFCLVFFALATLTASAQTAQVSGSVAFDGLPLPGVTVALIAGGSRYTQISDVNGKFEFLNVSPGKYRLTAELIGLKMRRKRLTVTAGSTVTTDLRMRMDQSQALCVDCGSSYPVMPDGPNFTITRQMMDTLPIQ